MVSAGSTLKIQKNNSEVMRADLAADHILIGRSPVCDIVLRAKNIAPVHFLIERQTVPLFEDSTTDMWLLFDISADKLRNSQDTDLVESAAGIVLDENPRELGGFEFNLLQDRLSPTTLREDAFMRGVEKRAEEQAKAIDYQGPFINAVEGLLYERQANAIVSLVHLPLGTKGRRTRPFKQLNEIAVTTLPGTNSLAKIDVKPTLQFSVRSKGSAGAENSLELLEATQPPQSFYLNKTDFLEIETERYRLYLRGIIFERVKLEKKPLVTSSALVFLMGILLFLVITSSIVTQVHDNVKPEPRRVVRIEHTRAAPAPQPEATQPAPAPMEQSAPPQDNVAAPPAAEATADSRGGSVGKQSGQQDWTKLVDKLKSSRAHEGFKAAGAEQSRPGQRGSSRQKQVWNDIPAGPPPSTEDIAGGAGEMAAPEIAAGRGAGRRLGRGGALQGVEANVQLDDAGAGTGASQGFGVNGGLTHKQVQGAINQYRGEIRGCYERQLLTTPNLKGRVAYEWVVRPDGSVQGVNEVESSLHSPDVENCIRKVISSMQFPTATSRVSTKVRYPFFLAPL